MSMTCSQRITNINENSYDDDITVTNIPMGHFIAVIGNVLQDGSTTREIKVEIMPLEAMEQTTQTTNSGLFVRSAGETEIQVEVYKDGQELCVNTMSY